MWWEFTWIRVLRAGKRKDGKSINKEGWRASVGGTRLELLGCVVEGRKEKRLQRANIGGKKIELLRDVLVSP